MVENFSIEPNPSPLDQHAREAFLQDPGFGKAFTDHMVTIEWDEKSGWHNARVRPRGPFEIDPASSVLHYAQEVFEGMKAYRLANGGLGLFRPEENVRRFAESARRLAMPELPVPLFLEAVTQLVSIDCAWVPQAPGSLYLRPFMFANEVFLGVRPAKRYTFCIIACPAGAYFKGGDAAIDLWVAPDFSRAAPGGTGAAKCGGNYAASLAAQQQAIAMGCDQVMFLDATEKRWVEELGGMNAFFLFDDRTLITPPLTGTILPGITRQSILELAGDLGLAASEQTYAFEQWQSDAESGRMHEAFACGTAAVVAGIGSVRFPTGSFQIGDGTCGPMTLSIRERIVGLQRGRESDDRGWLYRLAE